MTRREIIVGKLFGGYWPHRHDVYDLDWNVRTFVEKQCLRDFQICLTDLSFGNTPPDSSIAPSFSPNSTNIEPRTSRAMRLPG
jgi:hypothetical protein